MTIQQYQYRKEIPEYRAVCQAMEQCFQGITGCKQALPENRKRVLEELLLDIRKNIRMRKVIFAHSAKEGLRSFWSKRNIRSRMLDF